MPFNIQGPELILILIIALIVIGPGKLPDVGAALGKSIKEFRKASSDVRDATRLDAPAPAPVAPPATAEPAAPPAQVGPSAGAPPVQTTGLGAPVASEPSTTVPPETLPAEPVPSAPSSSDTSSDRPA